MTHLIESEGLLYRGADLAHPQEVWDYPRGRRVAYHGSAWSKPGVVIDEARGEALKANNPDAEHFRYYDDPPWRQPISEADREAILPEHVREAIARRKAELARRGKKSE